MSDYHVTDDELRTADVTVHRYHDCPDLRPGDAAHATDDDERQVTCPTCRSNLGLDALTPASDMAARVVCITIGDDEPDDADEFVAHVAEQLGAGYTSGHVDSTHYWSIKTTNEGGSDDQAT